MKKHAMHDVGEYLRQRGQRGDSVLAHINPQEAQFLAHTQGGDINPETGLPQFGLFSSIKKGIKNIGSGLKNVFQGDFKDAFDDIFSSGGLLGNFGDLAQNIAPYASVIPGIGPLISAGLGAGGSLLSGDDLNKILQSGAMGGIGGAGINAMGLGGSLGNFIPGLNSVPGMLNNAGLGSLLSNNMPGLAGMGPLGSLLGNVLGGGATGVTSGVPGSGLGGLGGLGGLLGGLLGGGGQMPGGAGGGFGGAGGGLNLGTLLGGIAGYNDDKPLEMRSVTSMPSWQEDQAKNAMGAAGSLYNSGQLGQVAGANPLMLNAAKGFKNSEDPYTQISQYLSGTLNDPLSLHRSHASTVDGANQQGYNKLMNSGDSTKGAAPSYYRDVLNKKYLDGNPYLQSVIDKAKGDLQSQTDSQFFAGGRGGSAANTRAMMTGMGDLENQLRYQDYTRERGVMDTAAAGLAGLGQQSFNNQAGLWQDLMGRRDQADRFNAGVRNDNSQFNAANANAMDQFNRNYGLSAANGMMDAQGGYIDALRQQMGAGDYMRNITQQQMDAPWTALQRYQQSIGQSGDYGGTVTQQQDQNKYQNAITGALLGQQLLGGQGGGGGSSGGGGGGGFWDTIGNFVGGLGSSFFGGGGGGGSPSFFGSNPSYPNFGSSTPPQYNLGSQSPWNLGGSGTPSFFGNPWGP